MSMVLPLPEREDGQVAGVELDLPPLPTRGRPPRQLRAEWLEAVEALMLDGITTASAMARATGLTRETATRWMREVEARWADDARRGVIEARRERLYQDAGLLVEDAMRRLSAAKHPLVACALTKVALEALRQQARLLGAYEATW